MKKGLSHMFNIFKSGSLQMKEDEAWSQVCIHVLICVGTHIYSLLNLLKFGNFFLIKMVLTFVTIA